MPYKHRDHIQPGQEIADSIKLKGGTLPGYPETDPESRSRPVLLPSPAPQTPTSQQSQEVSSSRKRKSIDAAHSFADENEEVSQPEK